MSFRNRNVTTGSSVQDFTGDDIVILCTSSSEHGRNESKQNSTSASCLVAAGDQW